MTADTLPTAENYEATRVLIPRLRRVAADLTDQAERITRLANRLAEGDLPSSTAAPYAELVGRTVNELMNTLANLQLGGIVSSSGNADVYRALGEPAGEVRS